MRQLLLSVLLLASPLQAADVRDCAGQVANARNVLWEDPTRTFANGAIRLILLDTEEPACCSVHVMVLHPIGDEPFLGCSLISRSEGYGWLRASLKEAASEYVSGQGLRVHIPMVGYGVEGEGPETLSLTINQATGQVTGQVAAE